MTIDHRFYMGVVAACIAVTACDIYVLMQQYRWDWLSVLIDCISILLVYLDWGMECQCYLFRRVLPCWCTNFGHFRCLCCIFIGVIGCLLPRFTFDFFTLNFKPADVDIIRERVRQGTYDDHPLGYDPTDAEDVERHRLLTEIINKDPQLFEKMENEYKEQEHDKETPLKELSSL